jgi:hypothetical protein
MAKRLPIPHQLKRFRYPGGRLLSRFVKFRLVLALTAIAALSAFASVSSAAAAGVVNGDFETGTLEGWQTHYQTGEGEWVTYEGAEPEEPGEFFRPPSGKYAALTEFHFPDSAILYQDVALEASATSQLSMYLYYRSGAPISVPSPNTLLVEEGFGPEENQQVRVDVMKPTAPIESLAPEDILATVYASKTGDPEELAPTRLTADLSKFAGQTVRLRIAVTAHENPIATGVDAVAITSTPIPAPAPAPAPTPVPPSNTIVKGKLALNKKNGSGFLAITVPGAGTLTATDAAVKVATASLTTKGAKKPALIKPTTLHPTSAGAVKVPIKPTAAGLKVLAKKGKLAFRARLTFTPTGGTAATQVYASKLIKTLKH